MPVVITLPIAWTAIEWVGSYFPIGFPWNLLGYTAYRNLELIQFAEFTGVYGVSALIIFANAVVYIVVLHATLRLTQAFSLRTLTVLMAVAFLFGTLRMRNVTAIASCGSIKISFVQWYLLHSR